MFGNIFFWALSLQPDRGRDVVTARALRFSDKKFSLLARNLITHVSFLCLPFPLGEIEIISLQGPNKKLIEHLNLFR